MEPLLNYFTIPVTEFNKQERKLAYWECGDKNNKKILFCVHGMTRNARDFDYLAMELAKTYRIICPDVPGRGKSDWLLDKAQYHNFNYALDIIGLIRHLGFTEVDWVGTSMGGLIGMAIASTTPGLIKKMVINDIGPFIPKDALRRIGEYAGSNPIFNNLDEVRKYFEVIYKPWSITKDEHWQHIMRHSLKQQQDGSYKFIYDPGIGANFRDENGNMKEIEDFNLWELWGKITCPVFVLRGALSDILPKDVALQMTQVGPKAKLHEFANIGHAPSLMSDDQIEIIRDWLL